MYSGIGPKAVVNRLSLTLGFLVDRPVLLAGREAGDEPAEDPADVAACAKISFSFKGGKREISAPLTRPKDRVDETEATTPMMEKAKATVSMSCEWR